MVPKGDSRKLQKETGQAVGKALGSVFGKAVDKVLENKQSEGKDKQ